MPRKAIPTSLMLSRRSFLKRTAAAIAGTVVGAPYIVPASVLGADAPSDKITIGCIGVGRMGRSDMREIMEFDEARVIAVCDVDTNRSKQAQALVEKQYGAQAKNGSYKGWYR